MGEIHSLGIVDRNELALQISEWEKNELRECAQSQRDRTRKEGMMETKKQRQIKGLRKSSWKVGQLEKLYFG